MTQENTNVEDTNKIDEETALENDVLKEEIKMQFHWYLGPFFLVYFVSYMIPGAIFMIYLLRFFIPYFLEVSSLNPSVSGYMPLIALLSIPLIIIGLYIIHLFLIAVITRFWWRLSEKILPTKDGVIPRNIPSKTLNFYHIRSFLIKYPKYKFTKGLFPWLSNWMYNFVGSNEIGKGTTIEEQVCADKYIKVGNNVYVGPNCVITSHLVEGIFGNIPYFQPRLGDNVTLGGLNCIGPATYLDDNTYVFPLSSGSKFNKLKGKNYYFGLPFRKIFKKKVAEYLDITQEDLERAKELEEKQLQSKEGETSD